MARIRISRRAVYWVVGIVIVACALYGTYMWQHNKVSDADAKVANVSAQNDLLDTKNASLSSQLNSLKQQKASSAKYTSGAPCEMAQLSLALHQNEGGAAGTGGALFAYQNNSDFSCTLDGYPGFLALDNQGHVVPNGPVQHSPLPSGKAAKTVTLAAGGRAYFRATWPLHNDSGTDDSCVNTSLILSVPPQNIYPLALSQSLGTMCTVTGRTVSVTPVAQLTDFQ